MQAKPWRMALLLIGTVLIFFVLAVLALGVLFGDGGGLALGQRVAVLPVTGPIIDSGPLIEQLIDFREDQSIKAIVLRVDSPGGGVGPSQEIHAEVLKTRAVKPVVVSIGSVAASGGYYISLPAQKILANPGSITGSIGVIMEFANVEELLGKIGLKSRVVKSGKLKDIGSPVRPMTAEERTLLQGMIDDVHQQFIDAVAAGRKMERGRVSELADGRIFSGRQALKVGLVDDLGGLQDAIAMAGELGGIGPEPEVVYPAQESGQWLRDLFAEGRSQIANMIMPRGSVPGLEFLWTGIEGR